MLAIGPRNASKRAVLQTSYAGLHACGTRCEGATLTSMIWSVFWQACALVVTFCHVMQSFRDVLLIAVARLPHVCHMAFLSVVFPGYDWLNCGNPNLQSCCALRRVTK